MADLVLNRHTSLSSEETITRAIQFFATAKWRPTTQSSRAATFEGRPPIPWFMLLLTVVGFMACFFPGMILYMMTIKKLRRFQNLVVTTTPATNGADVVVMYPKQAKNLAERFSSALPN
jgi:hypothetical protein